MLFGLSKKEHVNKKFSNLSYLSIFIIQAMWRDALGLAQGNCADTSFTFPADGQFILLLPLYLRLHSIILFFILLQIFTLPFLIHNSF